MNKEGESKDHPHIGMAVFFTGGMALALAAGLRFLGLMGKLDGFVESLFLLDGMPSPSASLSPVQLWGSSAFLAFLLPTVILNVPCLWRRLVIWGFTFALTLTWAPVLLLAAHKPEIGVTLVAILWSGFCAIFYSTNHLLPVDKPQTKDHGES